MLILTSLSSISQEFNFRYFNQKQGLTEPYIYEINQSQDGLLWLATSNGLFNYDGLNLQKRDTTFGLSTNFVKSFCFGKNKTLAGHNDGSLSIIYDSYAEKIDIKDSVFSPVNEIINYAENQFIGIIQNGLLFKVDDKNEVVHLQLAPGKIYTSIELIENKVYVASNEGLEIYEVTKSGFILKGSVSELEYIGIEDLCVSGKDLYIGTTDQGAYLLRNSKLIPIGVEIELNNKKISHIYKDGNSIWLTSFGEGIYQFTVKKSSFEFTTKIDKNSGLKSPYVNQIFIDREGTIWIGSYGDGLIQLIDQFISNYNLTEDNKYRYSSFFMNDYQYFGGNGVIHVQSITTDTSYILDQTYGLPDRTINSIFVDKYNTIWAGTQSDGLYSKPADKQNFQKVSYLDNSLSKQVHHINASNEYILVSTSDGLYFLGFDGRLEQQFTTQTGLPHNKINSTYVDDNNNVFICSNTQAIFYYNRVLKKYDLPKEIGIVEINDVCVDAKGDIWVATIGSGVLKKENGSFFKIDQSSGLASNFCYNILEDNKGRIWVTHRDAISNIDIASGKTRVLLNSDLDLQDIEPSSAFMSKSNVLWFGNQFGALTLDPKQEVDLNLKPKVSVQQVLVDDEYATDPHQINLRYGKHRLKINYRGVSLRNPDKVEYQYKLENFDDNWVAVTTQNFVEYNQIYDGDYVFKLRSRLKGGDWTEPVILSTIHVNKPLWKRWWFYLLLLAVIIGIFILVLRKREARLIRSKAILAKKLDERTHQITEQKNALARQNKDIGDSINYAKRIQSSILPPESILEDAFEDSFILLKPKDVVSGDFYWFDNFDGKVIVAAADATGHGVPGAFMSMIGSTLLKELVSNPNVSSPHLFLSLLDDRINTNLNQKGRVEDSKDGMDLAVCEFDMENLQLRYSGAYRPAWIMRDGELIELKGTRASIGGGITDKQKVFQLHFLQLKKGDSIYLFSDGFPDQFGGLKGKKLKSKGLLKVLLRVSKLSMKQQKIELDTFIEEWRGENDQIDDILIMGIKI